MQYQKISAGLNGAATTATELKENALTNKISFEAGAEYKTLNFVINEKQYSRPVHTLENVIERVAAGRRSRQQDEITRVFESHAVVESGVKETKPHIPKAKLPSALRALNVNATDEEVEAFFRFTDLNEDGFVEMEEFKIALKYMPPSPVEAWANSLPLSKLLADALPFVPGCSDLSVIASMTKTEANNVIDGLHLALREVLEEQLEMLRNSRTAWEIQEKSSEFTKSKFEILKYNCGNLEDFHGGLYKRVGSAHLDFEACMKNEHCTRSGSDHKFTAGNHSITTSPKQEWEIVVNGTAPDAQAMSGGRQIPSIEALLENPLSQRSKITREEVIALVLYTGPMVYPQLPFLPLSMAKTHIYALLQFYIYNVLLRRFPTDTFDFFRKGENLFPTTILVLASAVQRISRVTKLPQGMRLYRGLVGIKDLPDSFFKGDENGCRGFTEWGFMSTTASKDLAIRCSGVNAEQPLPCILEIRVGAVDRGACIRDFSQYPHEIEYLFVPCSYLEREGEKSYEITNHGVVCIFPVKVSANLKIWTLEELLSQKKKLHLAAFSYLIDEIRSELYVIGETEKAERRLASDTSKRPEDTVKGFIERIVEQCKDARSRHEAVSSADYMKVEVFCCLVLEMVDMKKMAISKMEEWLQNTSSSFIKFRWNAPLRTVHRRWIAFLQRRLAHSNGDKKVESLQLCQVQGLIVEGVNETNELQETRLMTAAAEGWSTKHLHLLHAAGANVNDSRPDGVTAMWLASQFGHIECVKALFAMKANVDQAANDGATPLYIASQRGSVECIRYLAEQKANVNKADRRGLTPVHQAAMNGHCGAIQVLHQLGAAIDALSQDGKSPIHLATETDHTECVEVLAKLSQCQDLGQQSCESMAEKHDKIPNSVVNRKMIISTGDISDIDGFLALAEYARTGADALFIMNYPAYIAVRDADEDESYADKNPGLGYKYSTSRVLSKKPTNEDHARMYHEFLSNYDQCDDNQRMKGALTDMAFAMAKGVWEEATTGGKLLFCIGGVSAVNPFSYAAIKNEILVYVPVVERPIAPLSTREGTIYDLERKAVNINWSEYSDIYIDHNGSMSFWNEYWNSTLDEVATKMKGAYIMGGVYNDTQPVTVPSIPNVLNRFSGATMNQLYHPQYSAEFFAFVSRNKIPVFTVANNVVHDLGQYVASSEPEKRFEVVEKFLQANGLTGPFLNRLASAYYRSQYKPPLKAYDFYTALAIMKDIKAENANALHSNLKHLYYSNAYGLIYLSSNADWEATRATYVSCIDTVVAETDTEFVRNKKERFQQEIAHLKGIDHLAWVPVHDLKFDLDNETLQLFVVDAQPVAAKNIST